MDADHFRQKAAHAREMATSGDDPWLCKMLLEVAHELQAEAESIDAEVALERRQFSRQPGQELAAWLIGLPDNGGAPTPVKVINISHGGARVRSEIGCPLGTDVILHLALEGLRLFGRIVHATGLEAGMAFEPASTQDPALSHYLQLRSAADAAHCATASGPATTRPAALGVDRMAASPSLATPQTLVSSQSLATPQILAAPDALDDVGRPV